MIGVLRHLNGNIYRCSQLIHRQMYSGCNRSLQYVFVRQTHDKRVNRRAIEARAKLQAPKFPDTSPAYVSAFEPDSGRPNMCEGMSSSKRANPCQNREILKAKACQEPPPPPSNLKWLWALLAAAGALGLIWLLTRKEKKKPTYKPPVYGVKVPPSSADIPSYVPYLLIGGGTASFSAFRAIKSLDPKAKVLMISNEYQTPYMRPPLSKELWYNAEFGKIPDGFSFKQWNGAERSLFYEPDEFYIDAKNLMGNENGGIAVCLGYHVKKVDSCNQQVVLTDGKRITYDKCLIATGCTPKTLEVFEGAPRCVKNNISQFRTPFDYERLKSICDEKKNIVIVGSGFLGSELACALAQYGRDKDVKIYQVFHESGNMAKVLPEYLSKWTMKQVQDQGVCVIPDTQVTEVASVHNQLKLHLSNGKSIFSDHIVVCVGCEANTELADTSQLEVDSKLGGFVVNAELEARRHLFVAGDAACFYDPLLGRRRVEHHDHSVVSGRLAGENMTGARKVYNHQSMFWSDLGPRIGYEGIGIVDSSLPTVGVFARASPEDLKKSVSHLEQISFKNEESEKKSDGKTEEKTVEKESTQSTSSTVTSVDEDDDEDDFGKGVIFYLKGEKVVGILLWNLFNRIGLARQIIKEDKSFSDLNEVAKLFEIHS